MACSLPHRACTVEEHGQNQAPVEATSRECFARLCSAVASVLLPADGSAASASNTPLQSHDAVIASLVARDRSIGASAAELTAGTVPTVPVREYPTRFGVLPAIDLVAWVSPLRASQVPAGVLPQSPARRRPASAAREDADDAALVADIAALMAADGRADGEKEGV